MEVRKRINVLSESGSVIDWKVNAGKSKVIVLGGKKLECKVCVDEIRLDHVSRI